MSRTSDTGSREEHRAALETRIEQLMDRLAGGDRDDDARDELLKEVAAYQAEHVPAYGRLVRARGVSTGSASLDELPAMPTDAFRYARIAAHPEREDARVFRTSGTTGGARGVHPFRDLSLYDRAAYIAGRDALFPDLVTMDQVILAPREHEAPDSSLSYMLERFASWFGAGHTTTWALSQGRFDLAALSAHLSEAELAGRPVAILGTSFAFVHLDEMLEDSRFRLPAQSRIMQTGGFKGRSRELSPDGMRELLAQRFDVPEPMVVAEYGMTELSSQMYERSLEDSLNGRTPRRTLFVPGWVRATVVDPETLHPVSDGERGILRLDDLANLDSACCVQTSDLAQASPEGILLLGRSPDAVPRGCSLAIDELLGDAHGR